MGGCVGYIRERRNQIEKERMANALSRTIERQLENFQRNDENVIKLLLLGTGNSGKSTILKQFQIFHKNGFLVEERDEVRLIMWRSAIQSIRLLVNWKDDLVYDDIKDDGYFAEGSIEINTLEDARTMKLGINGSGTRTPVENASPLPTKNRKIFGKDDLDADDVVGKLEIPPGMIYSKISNHKRGISDPAEPNESDSVPSSLNFCAPIDMDSNDIQPYYDFLQHEVKDDWPLHMVVKIYVAPGNTASRKTFEDDSKYNGFDMIPATPQSTNNPSDVGAPLSPSNRSNYSGDNSSYQNGVAATKSSSTLGLSNSNKTASMQDQIAATSAATITNHERKGNESNSEDVYLLKDHDADSGTFAATNSDGITNGTVSNPQVGGAVISDDQYIRLTISQLLQKIWRQPSVQYMFMRESKIPALEAPIAYIMQHIDRIAQKNYNPTDQDVLLARNRTEGVKRLDFESEGRTFQLVDVGGQISERRKWLNHFDNVDAVLYVVGLDGYDQVLVEDGKTNRLRDSLSLFKEMCEAPYFQYTNFILFLNKRDIFKKKIATIPLTVCFKSYTGDPHDFEAAISYIRKRFLDAHGRHVERLRQLPNTSRNGETILPIVYTHVTCATDPDGFHYMVLAVQSIFLRATMQQCGLV